MAGFREGVAISALYGSIAPSSHLSSYLSSHLHPVGHTFFLGRRTFGGVRKRLRSRVISLIGVGGGGTGGVPIS